MCWRKPPARGPRNKRPAPEQKRRAAQSWAPQENGGSAPGVWRIKRSEGQGRPPGPARPFLRFFTAPPGRARRAGFRPLFFAPAPRFARPVRLCAAQGAVRENEQIAFLHVFAPRGRAGAKKWRKCVVFFKFNACAHPFGRRRGRLCMPGLPLKMGNGKIFCFMVYWLVTEYMPAQRRAVRVCRPFT